MIPQVIGYVPKTAFKRWRERSLAMIIALLALEWACAQPSADASKISPSQEEAGEKMTITGRLIGPNDKPVAGGQVAVVKKGGFASPGRAIPLPSPMLPWRLCSPRPRGTGWLDNS
jgi:hypothetical protein